uniref:Phytocyanin domain-containing protein n=1 Tax=Davidia involucrata TaxID=16924 RepID=A0A5B7CBX2_DAVIN
MASRVELIGCLVVMAALLVGGATADTHTVGDSLGWTLPPGGPIAYSTWASREDFEIGDVIVFNWTGTHNVAQVSKADFDNCTSTNTIGTLQTTSPANFNLTTNETTYYICTVQSHCSLGQKVEIKIGSSSASSLTTSAFSALLVAMAIYFSSHM